MDSENSKHIKSDLHPRNRNRSSYDLKELCEQIPALKLFTFYNVRKELTVDFSKPKAVFLLNKAILAHYFGINNWDFSENNLCPPIPGRADYLHYVADLLGKDLGKHKIKGAKITGLDIGIGATCIYPILGVMEYGWNFIGSDISKDSIENAKLIVDRNVLLGGKIACRMQKDSTKFFQNILSEDEKITFSMCNPPFHASLEAAQKGTRRKVQNLRGKKDTVPTLNFSGALNELVCVGGELQFIQAMITESKGFAQKCCWFTTLVSKEAHIPKLLISLKKSKVLSYQIIPMGTANKASRILAWTFLDEVERKNWI